MRLVAALILALAALPAQAEVYKWVDDKGRTHYSNTPPQSVAGKAVPVEERISIMGMDPAVRAAAERRFAAQAERDERPQGPWFAALSTVPSGGLSPSYSPQYAPVYYAPVVVYRAPRAMHHPRPHRHSHRHSHRVPDRSR